MGGLEGKGEELKGDIKARVGDATNNPDMEAEGTPIRRRARPSRPSRTPRTACAILTTTTGSTDTSAENAAR